MTPSLRQRRIETLWQLLGGPPRARPDPVVAQREARQGYSVLRFSGPDPDDSWTASALVPDRPNGAGVLYCHAHGNRYDIGAREMLDGRPAMPAPLAPDLVGMGTTVLCVEMPGFGARQHDGTESALAKAALWEGDTLMGRMMRDLVRGLDVLSRIDGVDPARIASIGLSMGGTHAYWLAALDPRVAACAHCCVFADIAPLLRTGAHDLHGAYLTVPGLIDFGDMGTVAALVAPRPQLVCLGADDPLTPEIARAPALGKLQAAYSEDVGILRAHVEPEAGHEVTGAMRAAALDFLWQVL